MTPTAARFQQALLAYSQQSDADERAALEAELWAEFGAERAVLVLDMSGFSELSHRHGIVHYLSMVRRMQTTTEPIISRYSGSVVKYEADNGFAMFPDVAAAIEAALELHAAFRLANASTPDELDIRIACGIDYGPILVLPGEDFFGNAVNRASKLGEDLAGPGEILVTRDAVARLPSSHTWRFDERQFVISGLDFSACLLCVD